MCTFNSSIFILINSKLQNITLSFQNQIKSCIYVFTFFFSIKKIKFNTQLCPRRAMSKWLVVAKYCLICVSFNLLNFVNGIMHIQVFKLSIIIFRDINKKTWCWSDNSIEHDQTALLGCASWPGSILVAKTIRFQQNKG